MLQQLAQQLQDRAKAMDISLYRIEKDLGLSTTTVKTVFQLGSYKGKGYDVKHLLMIAEYLGIGMLRFDRTGINVKIEKR